MGYFNFPEKNSSDYSVLKLFWASSGNWHLNNYTLFHFHQNLSLNFGLKGVVSLDLKTFFKLNRKKKKNKEKKKLEEAAAESMAKGSNQEKQNSASEDTRTPAQKAYDKIQEKRVNLLLSLFSYYSLDSCIF